jgi:acyl carrier protein
MHGHESQVVVLPVDWEQMLRQFAGGATPTVIAHLGSGKPAGDLSIASKPGVAAGHLLKAIQDADTALRPRLMRNLVQRELIDVLGLDASLPFDPLHGFFEMGMDSLMAVELKNRLEAGFACSLPPTLSFDFPNAEALANHLLSLVAPPESPARAASEAEPDLDNLSESELAALLANELGELAAGG